MYNLLGEFIPTTPVEILENAPQKPNAPNAVLLAFSGGNDSRTLSHVVKDWFAGSDYALELAAIDTGLSMDGWKQSVEDYADWIGLPLSFWAGEGRDYYRQYVEHFGFPGQAMHSQIQTRLKGRAFAKMVRDRGRPCWILSGIRKAESRKRQRLTSPYSLREGGLFINPLFYWSNGQVLDYMDAHDIPLAPGGQWDCKCGCTAKRPDSEWGEISKEAPCLLAFLQSLKNPRPWAWAKFDPQLYQQHRQMEAGQSWFDDGSIDNYPVCINCWRDREADELSALNEWGL